MSIFGYFIKNVKTGMLYRTYVGKIYQSYEYEDALAVATMLNTKIGYEEFKVIENKGE